MPQLTSTKTDFAQNRRENYEMRVQDWTFSDDQDFTPPDFRVICEKEGLRAKLRPIAHPLIINLHQPFLRMRYGSVGLPGRPQLVSGSRGGGTQFLTRKIRKYKNPTAKRVLLLGVGFGPDLQYWARMRPEFIAGTEILNYTRAWKIIKKRYTQMRLEFFRTSGSDLSCFDDESFDIVGSTAVLEHVQDIPRLLSEVSRVLTKEGVVALSFSPLYYSFGGDHFSGTDHFKNGFNHVLLNDDEYMAYLKSIPFREENLADGRVWIFQKLFSYLKPVEYLKAFQEYFQVLFLRIHLSPKAVRFRSEFPHLYDEIISRKGLLQTDPLVAGMEVFLKKKPRPAPPFKLNDR